MLRTLEGRRRRRAVAVVCSGFVIAVLALALAGRHRTARAEPADSAPSAGDRGGVSGEEAGSPPASAARGDALPTSRELLFTAAGNRVYAYPPHLLAGANPASPRAAAPMVMMLHGMCGDARLACDFWSDAGREGSWLVCPAGNARCGEYDDWSGTGAEKAVALDHALETVDKAYPGAVAHAEGDILIGFSRGAFVARDVAYERPGRFRALILIGASMSPDAERLKASGIRRIVMAAGDYDGARPTMQRAARALDAAGIPTRYIGLGRIPHALPENLGEILRGAIQWIREK